MTTYTVFRLLAADAEVSGLTYDEAVKIMMERAGCTYRWERLGTETHLSVRYVGALPDTYDCVRQIKSPYFRSTNKNEDAAREEILRAFLRTGLLGVRIIPDESAVRIKHEVKNVLLGEGALA